MVQGTDYIGIIIYSKKKMRRMLLNKNKMGIILGVVSILLAIGSIISFYIGRGSNAEPFPFIFIVMLLSIIGIILAGFRYG